MSFELTSTAELLALWAVAGYLPAAIPFGTVPAPLLRRAPSPATGSANLRSTTVLTTRSPPGAALTLLSAADHDAYASHFTLASTPQY